MREHLETIYDLTLSSMKCRSTLVFYLKNNIHLLVPFPRNSHSDKAKKKPTPKPQSFEPTFIYSHFHHPMRNATRWTRSGIRSLDRILLSHTGLQSLFTKLILQATWIWRSWDSYYLLSIWVNNLWKRYCRRNSINKILFYFHAFSILIKRFGLSIKLSYLWSVVPSLLCGHRYAPLGPLAPFRVGIIYRIHEGQICSLS